MVGSYHLDKNHDILEEPGNYEFLDTVLVLRL